jgi:two-component system response regulator
MKGEVLTILLIEDNEDHAELVKRSFEDNAVANRLVHIKDGGEAEKYLFESEEMKDRRNYPNLILLDLRLPKIDGLDILKKIKTDEKLKNIPVVVLTSSHAERDLITAYTNYANSYLVKPLDFTKFTGMMKDLGFYWLGWNVNPFVK